MKVYMTDKDYGKDYIGIKRRLIEDRRYFGMDRDFVDPVKSWWCWSDLSIEDVQKLTYYLLYELVFNESVTSVAKVIPLLDDDCDLKVGLSVYMDEDSIYRKYDVKSDGVPLMISTVDIITMMGDLIEDIGDDGPGYYMREGFFRLAWKLGFVDELKKRL